MNIEIVPVMLEEKEILRNLLEKYDYEFSQYDNRDVNCLGMYGYEYLDFYWTDKNKYPYFIRVDGKLAGFVLISDYLEMFKDADYTIAEFFVMHKYRKLGVGTYAVNYLFDKFKGQWELKLHPKNIASVHFWNKVISQYTNGDYKLFKSYDHPLAKYDDGTFGDVFLFSTTK